MVSSIPSEFWFVDVTRVPAGDVVPAHAYAGTTLMAVLVPGIYAATPMNNVKYRA
jgi:hypothetical protein